MILNCSNKLYKAEQSLNLTDSNIATLIGENGSGKSSILESIFESEIQKDSLTVVAFSSGQNELFSGIYKKYVRSSKKFIVDNSNEVSNFYFDKDWVKWMVFFATTLYKDSLTRKYLIDKNYIDEDELKDDISSKISFSFRVDKMYSESISREIEEEANATEFNPYLKLLRKTKYHEVLEGILALINPDYDVEEGKSLNKGKYQIKSKDANDKLMKYSSNDVFSYLALASSGKDKYKNIFLEEIELFFKNNLEFKMLSDGEYQLLGIYALLDLFDSENTLFILDEIDSHLHFRNIEKLWKLLKDNVKGKIVTTTHISESISNNDFDNIYLIEKGEIREDLTPNEILKRISNITKSKKYTFKAASRIKNIALIDDEVDWVIFKKLAEKKIGKKVNLILDKIKPLKRSSSYDKSTEIFGKSKLIYTQEFIKANKEGSFNTENIFLICDKDEFPLSEIKDDLSVNIHESFKEEINKNLKGKLFLLSWKRREIENYLLSPSMLRSKGVLDDFKKQLPYSKIKIRSNLDLIRDVKEFDSKNILHPLYKEGGFDEQKLDDIVKLIPKNEISDDIVKMYEFLELKVTKHISS